MIKVNLIPKELRKKSKGQLMNEFVRVPVEYIVGLAGAVLLFIICAHLVIFLFNMGKIAERKIIEKEWKKIQPEKSQIDVVMNEINETNKKIKSLEKMTGEFGISWAEKLNIISDNLPRGIWLNRVSFEEDSLAINGSAISKQEKGMMTVHTLTSNLKGNSKFLTDLSDIELGSIKKRRIQKTQVADFIITSELEE